MATVSRRQGVVVVFDDAKGMGVLRDSGDAGLLEFHCTAITDGSRSIPVGAEVHYQVRLTHVGRHEASSITRI